MQAWTEVHGIAKAMTESNGAHRGSMRTCSARGTEKCRITKAAARDMAKDKEKPESSVRFAWSGSAAVKREMAVWIDPAQREKKIP